MRTVKRWRLIGVLHGLLPGNHDVVPASDYDALEAELKLQDDANEILTREIASAKNVQRIDGLALTVLVTRVAALETELRKIQSNNRATLGAEIDDVLRYSA